MGRKTKILLIVSLVIIVVGGVLLGKNLLNKNNSNNNDLAKYTGIWYKLPENIWQDYIDIKSINNNELTMEIFFYRIESFENVKINISNNKGTFKAYNKEGKYIDGILYLGNNNLSLEITNSTHENISKGKIDFNYHQNSEVAKVLNEIKNKIELQQNTLENDLAIKKELSVQHENGEYDLIITYKNQNMNLKSQFGKIDEQSLIKYKDNKDLVKFLDDNFNINSFKDNSNNKKYYLVGISNMEVTHTVNGVNEYYIVDEAGKTITKVEALINTLITNKDTTPILSNNKMVQLSNNRVQYIANDSVNKCEYAKYEMYLENGKVIKNKIKTYLDNEITIIGEGC